MRRCSDYVAGRRCHAAWVQIPASPLPSLVPSLVKGDPDLIRIIVTITWVNEVSRAAPHTP